MNSAYRRLGTNGSSPPLNTSQVHPSFRIPVLLCLGSFPFCQFFWAAFVLDLYSFLLLGCQESFDPRRDIYTVVDNHILVSLICISVIFLALLQHNFATKVLPVLNCGIATLVVYSLPTSFPTLIFAGFLVPASLVWTANSNKPHYSVSNGQCPRRFSTVKSTSNSCIYTEICCYGAWVERTW